MYIYTRIYIGGAHAQVSLITISSFNLYYLHISVNIGPICQQQMKFLIDVLCPQRDSLTQNLIQIEQVI